MKAWASSYIFLIIYIVQKWLWKQFLMGGIIRPWQTSELNWLLSCLIFRSPYAALILLYTLHRWSPDLQILSVIFLHTMALEKNSLELQIELPPSPICNGLAKFQDLYRQITVCDFYFLNEFTHSVESFKNSFEEYDTPHHFENTSANTKHFGIPHCTYSILIP